MNKNLGTKLAIILVVLLAFAYGIFGVPGGVSGSALLASMRNRIHLGLDLSGGTHLILQVQVNDAVNVDSDNALESLKSGMRTAKVNYTEITKPDPVNHPEQIVIKGVPTESSSDLRNLVQDRLQEYDATSGSNNTW
ncbi:MAG TPA: protein translocase subunit SecD, partial [Terriglobales bacterium]